MHSSPTYGIALPYSRYIRKCYLDKLATLQFERRKLFSENLQK